MVRDFAAALPEATIYVYDNNSARRHTGSATVRWPVRSSAPKTHQGKGNVVRRMFADIEAEVYVLVDGDGTYDAPSARRMVDHLLANSLDMVNGARVDRRCQRIPSGSRVRQWAADRHGRRDLRRPAEGHAVGLPRDVATVHQVVPRARQRVRDRDGADRSRARVRLPIAEVQTPYRDRPVGSLSKLRTFRDGWRILRTIFFLVKEERPLQFFCARRRWCW